MSDIKYIIAGDDREHTRFPCLAVVRYAAATVVTVLALAVIAMVIHAMLRSEDIRLSVNDGFIEADILYSQEPHSTQEVNSKQTQRPAATASASSVAVRRPSQTPDSLHAGVGKLGDPESSTTTSSGVNPVDIGDQTQTEPADQTNYGTNGEEDEITHPNLGTRSQGGDFGIGDEITHPNLGTSSQGGDFGIGDEIPHPNVGTNYGNNGATNVTLQRANTTNLRVTLIANNPGGRTKIDCNQTTVTLIDITGYEIGTLQLGNFTVQPQTTITLQKRLKIDHAATLSYIWDHHGGAHSFGVTVKVSASVTSYPLGKKTQTKPQTYVCQRVTVGLTDYETYLATDDAECRAVPTGTPAWAPAPAPAPARAR